MAPREGSVKLIPLGGLREIGMNCLLLEAHGRLLVLDCGVAFPSPPTSGVDIIHPLFDSLLARREQVEAVVLTHGHEDHIAALPYLLRELDVPFYAAPYTLGLVKSRLAEFEDVGITAGREFTPGDKFSVGPFDLTTFPMPHSIVDNAGLLIETAGRRILHTGDFKLSGSTGGMEGSALERLLELSTGGVDLLLCDSTGAEESSVARSESVVTARLETIVSDAPGAVFVGMFSSNVERIRSLAQVAIRTGRKIALEGRSVKNHVGIASDLDLVRGLSQVMVTTEAAAQLPRTKIIIIASGTQGEERSALGRFSTGMNKTFPVIAGDTVVLSSRFIPGSELAISRMIDRFLELGARVVHKGIDPDVHVSGHGGREEIRSVIETVSPRAFMPIHGTLRHLTACAEIARTQGVSQTVVATNGQVVELDSGGLAIHKEPVDAGRVHVDAGISIPPSVLRERWLMGHRGVLVVAWVMGENSQTTGEITVVHRGVVAEEMTDWFCSLIRDELRRTLDEMAPNERLDDSIFTGKIRSTLRKLTQKTISREPYVIINPYR